MTSPFYVRFLLRIAVKQGIAVLENALADCFGGGGMQMTSSSTPGQSFVFTPDPKMSQSDLAENLEEAISTFERLGSVEAVQAYLAQPRVTVARASLC